MSTILGTGVPPSGLLVHLDAGNIKSYPKTGSVWTDLSGNGNHTTLYNSPTYNSDFSGSLIFNAGPYGVVQNAVLSRQTYTKLAWFKFTTLYSSNNIISGFSSGHAFWGGSSTKLQAGHQNNGYVTIESTTTLKENIWYFGAVTFDSSVGWKLYLNGNLEATSSNLVIFDGNTDIALGSFGGSGNNLNGNIGMAMVYNRILSATEIKQVYNSTVNRFSTKLLISPKAICDLDPANPASWPGSGSNLIDLTGNGYNFAATASDFATYNGQTVLRLDGSLARRAISGLNITLPYTILAVTRYNGLGSNRRNRTITSNNNNWLMNHWNGNKRTYFAEGWVSYGVTGANDNDWVIGIVTGNSTYGDFHCYFDSATDSSDYPNNGSAAPGGIALGGYGAYNEPSNCDIGLFRVYNGELSVIQIQQIYNSIKSRFGQ